jgi:hypothetical protein
LIYIRTWDVERQKPIQIAKRSSHDWFSKRIWSSIFSLGVARGVVDVAREHNINAISFAGQYVHDTRGFKAQANILYGLINAEQLDGLVI